MTRLFQRCLIVWLLALVSSGSLRAADSWLEIRTPHFTVSSNAGEKEARRIANQFEEIRAVFHSAFPALRVDPGEPLLIIAVKNEDSLKVLLPDYWTTKDRAHPAGLYLPRRDESFAILRTDVTGSAENAYHSLYHEYTHAIMRLNFNGLPVWLNEGLAELYGNTVVDDSETDVGRVSHAQLALLQRSSFIPLEQLMNADVRSPLYNERDRASIFYAESWAIVHYLTFDPEASKQNYLNQYFKAWEETRDGAEAARQAFDDLKKFESRVEGYSRQTAFYYQRRKPEAHLSPDDLVVRSLSPAEVLVLQADFLQHTNHMPEARQMLRQALEMEPNLASAHACIGFDSFTQYNNDEAEKEFKQAADLDPKNFRVFFYLAEVTDRKAGYSTQSTPQIIEYLEKTVQLNPNFAPAYAFLSVAYRQPPPAKEKALDAAHQANRLEPTVMAYAVDIGNAYIALDRVPEARTVSISLSKIASTPQDKAIAQSFAKRLARYEDYVAKKNSGAPASPPASGDDSAPSQDADDTASSSKSNDTATNSLAQGVQTPRSEDGLIRDVDCTALPHAKIQFAILGETLRLSVNDVASLTYQIGGKDSSAGAIPCSQWKGRKAKITFQPSPGPESSGEATSIDFL